VSENTDPGRESTSDPFAVLGLARRFGLADSEIERAFLTRLGGVHPDLAGEEASLDAAALTEARATLADPERRGVALLALLGGPSASEDRSLPAGFLMEMMELRERIESELADASAGGGGAGGEEAARARWASFGEERRRGHMERVAALFEGMGADPAGVLARVREELNAWRYTERLIEQLDPAYDPARADFAE
jgi:DnaJ-domain-containing protein 1